MQKTEEQTHRLKQIVSVITIFALFVLVFAIRHQIVETFRNLGQVNLWFLWLMPVMQIGNYHAYTQMYRHLLWILNERIRYRSMMRVQLELNFVNNVFPSGGVSGISYFGLRMKDAQVTGGKSTLVQVMKFTLLFVSFQIFLGIGLLLLSFSGRTNNFLIMVVTTLSSFLLVGTLLFAYIMSNQNRINGFFTFITKILNRIIHVFRRKHPETIKIDNVRALFTELHEGYMVIKSDIRVLKKPLLFALLANTTEILTIYSVYMAFGEFVNPGAVIIAYAVANFAGLISVLPGGVGVYEALMTGVLVAAGVPAALSLPVTVMYRILNSLIQLPPRYYLYHKNLHKRKSKESD